MLRLYENEAYLYEENSYKRPASLTLNIVNLILSTVYCIPMVTLFVVYNLGFSQSFILSAIGSIETILLIDFYFLTIPAFLCSIVTFGVNLGKSIEAKEDKTEKILLTLLSIVSIIFICCLASFFKNSMW